MNFPYSISPLDYKEYIIGVIRPHSVFLGFLDYVIHNFILINVNVIPLHAGCTSRHPLEV